MDERAFILTDLIKKDNFINRRSPILDRPVADQVPQRGELGRVPVLELQVDDVSHADLAPLQQALCGPLRSACKIHSLADSWRGRGL